MKLSRGCRSLRCRAGLFALLVSAGCYSQPSGFSKRIPSSEFESVRIAAGKGDPKAAVRLYEYYEFYADDHGQALYWLRVGAMAGDRESAQRLGLVLTRHDDNVFEGVCWLEHAASRGDVIAAEELARLRAPVRSGTTRSADPNSSSGSRDPTSAPRPAS